ncbi:hypothetical protein [Saccharopolyspora sp. ASAGF58]|uniref:hypothetical protein n=1 Tax=Saccharopolyspora sp. ASAGF58 TaxID=2719023 RepID=UPI001B314EF5|nr:hypothetical protein [Saccharopolyspora sp. ASAGF58]
MSYGELREQTLTSTNELCTALDFLDFLVFVETLGNASGIRIDEDDYDRLTTMDSAVDFLTAWS